MEARTIRVADVRRRAVGVQGLGEEELATLLAELMPELAASAPDAPLAFTRAMQALVPLAAAARSAAAAVPGPGARPALFLRQLLTEPGFVPVVAQDDVGSTRVQFPRRRDGVAPDGRPLSVPAEQAAQVAALRAAPPFAGPQPQSHAGALAWRAAVPPPAAGGQHATPGELEALAQWYRLYAEFAARHAAAWALLRAPRPAASLADLVVRVPGPAPPAADTPAARLLRMLTGVSAPLPPQAVLGDIVRQGGLAALVQLSVGQGGRAREFIEAAALEARSRRSREEAEERQVAAQVLAGQYLIILEDLYGAALIRELAAAAGDPLHGRAVLPTSPAEVLRLAGEARARRVQDEYARREEEWRQQSANRCPHVQLLLSLRGAPGSDRAMRLLKQLRGFFAGGGDAMAWISCASCGFRVICPHSVERLELEAAGAPFAEVRRRLERYADPALRETRGMYCRVCGALIADRFRDTEETPAEALGRAGSLDDPLRGEVWAASMRVARLLRFSLPVDPRRFADVAVGVCFPPLLAAFDALRGRARGRAEHAALPEDALRELLAAVYAAAYAFALVTGAREPAAGSPVRVTLDGVPAGAPPSAAARRLLEQVTRDQHRALQQLVGITNEYVADRFREAYRQVAMGGSSMLTAQSATKVVLSETMAVDPAFRFAGTVLAAAGLLPVLPPEDPEGAGAEYRAVMGRPLAEVAAAEPPARLLAFTGNAAGRRAVIELPPGTDPHFVHKAEGMNLYAGLAPPPPTDGLRMAELGAAGRAFAAVLEQAPGLGVVWYGGRAARPRRWARPARPEGLQAERLARAYQLFHWKTTRLASAEQLPAFLEAQRAARLEDLACEVERSLDALKPRLAFPPGRARFGDSAAWKELAAGRMPVTVLYDEEGRPHVWDVFVFAGAGAPGGRVEAPAAEVKRWLDGRGTLGLALVDYRCSACGTLRSEARGLDAGRARAALDSLHERDSFFAFYQTRCPEGGLHDWDAPGGVCAKCGAGPLTRAGTPEGQAYYARFRAAFARARFPPRPRLEEPPPPPRLAVPGVPDDIGPVVAAAKLLADAGHPATPELFEAIGATAGRTVEQVLRGVEAPPPPACRDDPRILATEGAVLAFAAMYNAMRFYGRRPAPLASAELDLRAAELAREGGWPESDEFPDHGLSGFAAEHQALFLDADSQEKVAALHRHALRALCGAVARLGAGRGGDGPLAAALAGDLAVAAAAKILRGELLLSKPGVFNFAIFGSEEVAGADDGSAEEPSFEPADEGGKDPFSADALDVDTPENLE